MKKTILIMALIFGCLNVNAAEKKVKITGHYLNFPISHKENRQRMTIQVKGKDYCSFVIRLAQSNPEYWVFQDVSDLKGKTITIQYEGDENKLQGLLQTDTPYVDNLYREPNRPQYHFTTKRGWINDPNGLIFFKGKYHLFYQHNPYERDWENMHWGHAISTDLIHWQELPDALHPDSIGTIFSGSAVADMNNSSHFAKKSGQIPIVAVYTANRDDAQRQCLAYSLDDGMTFRKFEGNPVLDTHKVWDSHDTRDPFVFWYAPTGKWVMVLNERTGHSIYNSDDLIHWNYKSHITGFWECPSLFPITVAGTSEKLWVLWDASGSYLVGHFNGETFQPVGVKQINLNGSAYAAQVFNNIPDSDGRVIKMTWGRIDFGTDPFKGIMLLPQEQTLHKTPTGYKLYSYPIKEMDKIFQPVFQADNLSCDDANKMLQRVGQDDMIRIQATLHLTYATDAGLSFKNQRLVTYELNNNHLNGAFYAKDDPTSMDLDIDVFVDRNVVEVFADKGAFSTSFLIHPQEDNKQGYQFFGNQLQVKNLKVSRAQSIWK